MKKLSLLLSAVALVSVISCKKDNNSPKATQQDMIVGKWNLQKQNVAEYVDGVSVSDSTLTASNKIVSYTQFDKSGSFTSVSVYNSAGIGSLSPSSVTAVDSLKGTYTFTGSLFSLSTLSVGSLSAPTITGGSLNSLPKYELLSQAAKIVTLTSSALTVHTEYAIKQTVGNVSQTYKTVEDSYFTR